MAYTKIHAIKATVDKAIDYICNSDKTDENIFISSFACSPETAAIDFKYTLDHCREISINKAYHLMQAFQPGEVSFDEAHQIGQELADRLLEGKYSYIVSTHIDKGHVHNHIIFCAADNIDHDKYHDCKQSYYRIRSISDALCKEHQLSIITPSQKSGVKYNEWNANQSGTSWKTQIRKDINQSIKSSSSYDEFLTLMRAKGYEFKEGQYISFRPLGKERFVRGSEKSLGAEYTKERIQYRLENNVHLSTTIKSENKKIRKLIVTTSDQRYQENTGLKRWASKENLKIAANTYNLMYSRDIKGFTELNNTISSIKSQQKSAKVGLVTLEHKLKDLAEIIKYVKQYQENLPYNLKYERAKNKDSVFQKYESQIILFGGAERMLKRLCITPSAINSGKLTLEYQELLQQKAELNSSLKNFQKKLKELDIIKQTMDQFFKPIQAENNKPTTHSKYL